MNCQSGNRCDFWMRKVSSECLPVGYLLRYMRAHMKTSIIFAQIVFLKSPFILTLNLIRFSAGEGICPIYVFQSKKECSKIKTNWIPVPQQLLKTFSNFLERTDFCFFKNSLKRSFWLITYYQTIKEITFTVCYYCNLPANSLYQTSHREQLNLATIGMEELNAVKISVDIKIIELIIIF